MAERAANLIDCYIATDYWVSYVFLEYKGYVYLTLLTVAVIGL